MVEKRWDSEKGRGDFVGKYLEDERLCMGSFVMVKKVLKKERNGVVSVLEALLNRGVEE
jgi:hypothetical protein